MRQKTKVSKSVAALLLGLLFVLLAACRADGEGGGGTDPGDPDDPSTISFSVTPSPGRVTQALVTAYEVPGSASGSLTTLGQESTGETGIAEFTFEGDSLPPVLLLSVELTLASRVFDNSFEQHLTIPATTAGTQYWALVVGLGDGDEVGVSLFSNVAAQIGDRTPGGLAALTQTAVNQINDAVGVALTPGVSGLDVISIPLIAVPATESLDNDPEGLQTLYALSYAALGVNVGGPAPSPSTELPSLVALSQLSRDAATGTIDGRDGGGLLIEGLRYNALQFTRAYETAIRANAGLYGTQALVDYVQTINTRRFILRDPNCTEAFISNYFALNAGVIELPVLEVSGYDGVFTEGETYEVTLAANGELQIETDSGTISVPANEIFTCSLSTFGGVTNFSLVRYLSDFSGDGDRNEEIVILGSGPGAPAGSGPEGGMYIADESGDKYVILGPSDGPPDTCILPGAQEDCPPGGPDPSPLSCSIDGYQTFAGEGVGTTVTAQADTSGLLCLLGACSVTNPLWAVDNVLNSASVINLPAGGLLGILGAVELSLSNSAPPFDADIPSRVGLLIGIPESLLSVGLLDSLVISTYEGGVLRDSGTSGSLLVLNVADLVTLNFDTNLRLVSIPTTSTFDEIRVEVGGGLLSVATNLSVYEACYLP